MAHSKNFPIFTLYLRALYPMSNIQKYVLGDIKESFVATLNTLSKNGLFLGYSGWLGTCSPADSLFYE